MSILLSVDFYAALRRIIPQLPEKGVVECWTFCTARDVARVTLRMEALDDKQEPVVVGDHIATVEQTFVIIPKERYEAFKNDHPNEFKLL